MQSKLIKNKNFYANIFLIIILIWFSFYVLSEIYNSLPSFDGAFNMQVPLNLIETGRYATSYDGITDFNHDITTGPPLLFLNAVVFWLFGVSSFISLIPNAIYLILTAILFFIYVKYLFNNWLGLMALIVFIQTPHIQMWGLAGYGEIPALFYLILSLFLFKLIETRENKILIGLMSGCFFGLAYLTKTIMLIAVPSFIVISFLDLLILKRISKRVYIIMFLGFVGIVSLFEIYKFSSLGLIDYCQWWKIEIGTVFRETGLSTGLFNSSSIIGKIKNHIIVLSNEMNISVIALITFLVLPYVLIVIKYAKKLLKKDYLDVSLSFLMLAGISFTYLTWWFFIDNWAWYRRIFDGIIIHEVVTVIIIGLIIYDIIYKVIIRKSQLYWKNFFLIGLSTILLVSLVFQSCVNISKIRIKNNYYESELAAKKMAQYINTLPPDVKLFGVGWWQAPVISFLTRRTVYNIYNADSYKINSSNNRSYFIVDDYANNLGYKEISSTLDWICGKNVENFGPFSLYELEEFKKIDCASNHTDGNWVNGVARSWATAFFVANSLQARKELTVDSKIYFADGVTRTIVSTKENADSLIIFLNGSPMDGTVVGYPQKFIIYPDN